MIVMRTCLHKCKRRRKRRGKEEKVNNTQGDKKRRLTKKRKKKVEGGRREGNKKRRGNQVKKKTKNKKKGKHKRVQHQEWHCKPCSIFKQLPARCPHPPMARQALAKSRKTGKPWRQVKSCSRVQLLQPLGKHLPHLLGVL